MTSIFPWSIYWCFSFFYSMKHYKTWMDAGPALLSRYPCPSLICFRPWSEQLVLSIICSERKRIMEFYKIFHSRCQKKSEIVKSRIGRCPFISNAEGIPSSQIPTQVWNIKLPHLWDLSAKYKYEFT